MRTDAARAAHTPKHLLATLTAESWELQALCRGPLAYWWDDHLDGAHSETPTERWARHARAIEVCQTCPVRSACAVAAAHVKRPEGIWAGNLIGGPLIRAGETCLQCEKPMLPGKSHKPLPAGWARHNAYGYCRPCLERACRHPEMVGA